MASLNIFESIKKARMGGQIEPIHSQFLGDALRVSLKGDRTLFDGVWRLCAPADWDPPKNARVKNEFELNEGQRIDILLKDKDHGRRVGIEVKTSERYVRREQLNDYLQGLRNKCDDALIAIAYLTPFNRPRAKQIIRKFNANRDPGEAEIQGGIAAALSTVGEFERFKNSVTPFDRARHVSWLDVADINWDGGEVWEQHQAYVRDNLASPEKLKKAFPRNQMFCEFFSEEAFANFLDALPSEFRDCCDRRVELDLGSLGETFGPAELARALTFLIEDDKFVARDKSRDDKFDDELKKPFLESQYSEFHGALFGLTRFNHVWVEGKGNYGLRVAHRIARGKRVSLVTSTDESRLTMGGRK